MDSENNKSYKNIEYIKYPEDFVILREGPADEDAFELHAHQKIAESIADIICKDDKGISIGLDGGWGSGKSTIVKLIQRTINKKLRKQVNSEIRTEIKNEKNIVTKTDNCRKTIKDKTNRKKPFIFIFDAWAHEGDSLRRVFIESLMRNLYPNKFSYKDIHHTKLDEDEKLFYKISGKLTETRKTDKNKLTYWGKMLGLFMLLVPVGIAIFSSSSNTGINIKDCWTIVGAILTILPFIISVIAWIFGTQIFEDDIINIETSTLTDGIEKSSAEFEFYFEKILNNYFQDRKLVIVIDNLDRIDPDDAKRVWSTLQTFIHHRNKTHTPIFLIVPYEYKGVTKLWNDYDGTPNNNDERTDASQQAESTNNRGKSFLDKVFQIRFDVPQIRLTDWKEYTKKMIHESIVDEDKTFYDKHYTTPIIMSIELTREINDIPKPREIKQFINQVNILRQTVDKSITIESIAFYAVYRYIKNYDVASIINGLIKRTIPEINPKQVYNIRIGMSAIAFSSDYNGGFQHLLSNIIDEELNRINDLLDPNHDTMTAAVSLQEFAKNNGNDFWTIFKYKFYKHYYTNRLDSNQDISFDNYLFNIVAVIELINIELYKEIQEQKDSFLKELEKILTRRIRSKTKFNLPVFRTFEDYHHFAKHIDDNNITKVLSIFMKNICAKIEENNIDNELLNKWSEELKMFFDNIITKQGNKININTIVNLHNLSVNDKTLFLAKILLMKEDTYNLVNINASHLNDVSTLFDICSYLVKLKLNHIFHYDFTDIIKHIKVKDIKIDYLKIVTVLAVNNNFTQDELQPFVDRYNTLSNAISQLENRDMIRYCSVLFIYYYDTTTDSTETFLNSKMEDDYNWLEKFCNDYKCHEILWLKASLMHNKYIGALKLIINNPKTMPKLFAHEMKNTIIENLKNNQFSQEDIDIFLNQIGIQYPNIPRLI